jgi:hypothetical protein
VPIYLCSDCQARNVEGGDCIQCGRSLGRMDRAVWAAAGSSFLLGALWVGSAVLLKLQIGWVAALYGALVSGAVAHYSGGRGVAYQAVATAFTLLGLLLSETLVVLSLWDQLTARWGLDVPRPDPWELVVYLVQYDGATILFCLLGVAGGFWLWRQPSGQ